jgi:uncharacterized delta-60 repeat protein
MSLMTLPALCRLRFPCASALSAAAVLRWLRVTFLLSAILAALPAASAQIAGQLDPLNAKIVGTYVRTVVLQPDGRMIIAGEFTSVQDTPRNNIARLNPDGSLDTAFDVGANSWIYSVVVQPDGKILLGGNFISIKPAGSATSVSRRYMARLLPDGKLDPDFNPNPNGDVTSIALQPDGQIICGGYFTSFAPPGSPTPVDREHLARLEADGTLDPLFNLPVQAFVYCVALQPNGAILVGGRIPGAGATFGPGYIFRVNPDLTLDQTFAPLLNGYVNSIAIQPDGRILLGGAFNAYRADLMTPPVTRCYILRLFATGLLDQAFNPNPNGIVECLAVQTDNRILMGGAFNALQPPNTATPTDRQHLARVNADGSVDFTFTPKTDNDVTSIALQMDGRILVGGYFTVFLPGAGRKYFARLTNGDHTQTITQPALDQVLWERTGALPEVEEVVFEQSTDDGANWSLLGIPTRVVATPASWEFTAAAPLADGTLLRARAVSSTGNRGFGRLEFPVPASLTAREEWNQTWFGSTSSTGDAASDADPNDNGVSNLLEYALGGDPVGNTTGTSILPQVSTDSSGLLQLSFKRYPDRNDITIVVQAADNAETGPWEDFASSVNGAPFAVLLPGYSVTESGSGESRDVISTDKPGGTSPLRFLRIKVTES